MALDGGRLAPAGLDNVGIDRALREELHIRQLLGFFLKDADELRADDLALLLRIGDALERCEEALCRVDADKVDGRAAEGALDLVALVFAHQAVVDEDAMYLTGDGLREQHRADRAVHAAGQRQQHMRAADLLAHGLDQLLLEILQVVVARSAADLIEEVADDLRAVRRGFDLGVELHGVDLPRRAGHRCVRAGGCVRHGGKALREHSDLIGVAHQADLLGGKALEQRAGRVDLHRCLAVFARRARRDRPAEAPRRQLRTIADAEHRDAKFEDALVTVRRVVEIDTVRPAGQNDADGVQRLDLLGGQIAGLDDRINAALADAPRDQLLVLSSEIED